MANWRNLAISAILADGKIDEAEVKVLKKELYADGRITTDEFKFLADLRNEAQKKAKARKEELSPAFEKFFFKAIEDKVLDNGRISQAEVKLLRNLIYADGKIDAGEAKLLDTLKKKATSVHAEFDKFYEEAMAKHAKAKK